VITSHATNPIPLHGRLPIGAPNDKSIPHGTAGTRQVPEGCKNSIEAGDCFLLFREVLVVVMTGEQQIMSGLLKQALELGASMAGYVPAKTLRNCPSAQVAGPQGFQTFTGTILVLGLYHDPEKPEMDWWEEGRSTPGDRMLQRINRELKVWLKEEFGIAATDIPYQVSDGGIYLKDAAVLAGIGYIGKNNLVITPDFGPSVRFRALWVGIDTEKSALHTQEPLCGQCDRPCEAECPQNAFAGGRFSRERCAARLAADKADRKQSGHHVPCRVCELVCPANMVP
jgi:epoxyqueuosine reductase